ARALALFVLAVPLPILLGVMVYLWADARAAKKAAEEQKLAADRERELAQNYLQSALGTMDRIVERVGDERLARSPAVQEERAARGPSWPRPGPRSAPASRRTGRRPPTATAAWGTTSPSPTPAKARPTSTRPCGWPTVCTPSTRSRPSTSPCSRPCSGRTATSWWPAGGRPTPPRSWTAGWPCSASCPTPVRGPPGPG